MGAACCGGTRSVEEPTPSPIPAKEEPAKPLQPVGKKIRLTPTKVASDAKLYFIQTKSINTEDADSLSARFEDEKLEEEFVKHYLSMPLRASNGKQTQFCKAFQKDSSFYRVDCDESGQPYFFKLNGVQGDKYEFVECTESFTPDDWTWDNVKVGAVEFVYITELIDYERKLFFAIFMDPSQKKQPKAQVEKKPKKPKEKIHWVEFPKGTKFWYFLTPVVDKNNDAIDGEGFQSVEFDKLYYDNYQNWNIVASNGNTTYFWRAFLNDDNWYRINCDSHGNWYYFRFVKENENGDYIYHECGEEEIDSLDESSWSWENKKFTRGDQDVELEFVTEIYDPVSKKFYVLYAEPASESPAKGAAATAATKGRAKIQPVSFAEGTKFVYFLTPVVEGNNEDIIGTGVISEELDKLFEANYQKWDITASNGKNTKFWRAFLSNGKWYRINCDEDGNWYCFLFKEKTEAGDYVYEECSSALLDEFDESAWHWESQKFVSGSHEVDLDFVTEIFEPSTENYFVMYKGHWNGESEEPIQEVTDSVAEPVKQMVDDIPRWTNISKGQRLWYFLTPAIEGNNDEISGEGMESEELDELYHKYYQEWDIESASGTATRFYRAFLKDGEWFRINVDSEGNLYFFKYNSRDENGDYLYEEYESSQVTGWTEDAWTWESKRFKVNGSEVDLVFLTELYDPSTENYFVVFAEPAGLRTQEGSEEPASAAARAPHVFSAVELPEEPVPLTLPAGTKLYYYLTPVTEGVNSQLEGTPFESDEYDLSFKRDYLDHKITKDGKETHFSKAFQNNGWFRIHKDEDGNKYYFKYTGKDEQGAAIYEDCTEEEIAKVDTKSTHWKSQQFAKGEESVLLQFVTEYWDVSVDNYYVVYAQYP